jgi:hypothetical protein
MNQNSIREGIKNRECLLSFGEESFVFQFAIQKNIKIKIYRTVILSVFCVGVKFGRSDLGRNVS